MTTIKRVNKGVRDPRKEATDRLLFAARDYLALEGWAALVASAERIQQCPDGTGFSYELVIKFTGGRIKGATAQNRGTTHAMSRLTKLTTTEANAPKPKPPDNINPVAWEYYHDDLACWMATRAERFLSGI